MILILILSINGSSSFMGLFRRGLNLLANVAQITYQTAEAGAGLPNAAAKEEFSVVNEVGDGGSIILTESDFRLVFEEINYFREKVVSVGKSFHERNEMMKILVHWQTDPLNRFSIHWKEHYTTIYLIIYERSRDVFIPNSILTEYLLFFAENVVNCNGGSFVFKQIIDRSVQLLKSMIMYATRPSIIQVFLNRIHYHLREEHRIPIFQACHGLLNSIAGETSLMYEEPFRAKLLNRAFRIYFTILRYFDISVLELRSFYRIIKPHPIIAPFVDLIIFYRVFKMLPSVNFDCIHTFPLNFSDISLVDYIKALNFILKETEFTNNFGKSSEVFHWKRD